MKKYLLLLLTMLLVGCFNKTTTVTEKEMSTETTQIEDTSNAYEALDAELQIPETLSEEVKTVLREVLVETPNYLRGALDDGYLAPYFVTISYPLQDFVYISRKYGSEIYFVEPFGNYQNQDVVMLYDESVAESEWIYANKIKKAVIFYKMSETIDPTLGIPEDFDPPVKDFLQQVLTESPYQFKAKVDREAMGIDHLPAIYNGKSIEIDENLGTRVVYVPAFGEYKHDDIVGIYEEEIANKATLEFSKIVKAVVFQ